MSKIITFGDKASGILIEYTKSRDTLSFFGWYNTYVGIKGDEITVDEFCERLGIKRGGKRK